jgi:eukaryotic-like serine/threonine-protein kinase
MLQNDRLLSQPEERLEEAILCYLRAGDDERPLSPEHLLGQYPEVCSQLERFFADEDRLGPLLAPLRSSARPKAAVYPREFGRYELLEEIGRGGMGVVYKARQRELGRLVALKTIRVGGLASKSELRRFQNEAESIGRLDHPHIVPIHDVARHDGQMFFTMPLLARQLNHDLGRFRNDHQSAARLVATIARALHHAHQRGILHRDVKPSNILLDDTDRPFIADFGLAKRLDVETTLTESGAILGTPGYLAPEQAAGTSLAVTTSSDIYGLGAVLYTLLTGKPPLAGGTVLETLARVKDHDPESPSRCNPQVDHDLEAICLKCLEKEPSRRYGSAEALAEDLERWQRGEPIYARPLGRSGRLWRWCRRNPAFAAMAAVIALLALFGLSSLAVGFVLVKEQRRIADQHREAAEENAARLRRQLYVANVSRGFGHLERFEIGELRRLLDDSSSDHMSNRFEWRYLRRATTMGPRQILSYTSHAGTIYDVAWSSDFQLVASCGEDRSIHIWTAATGKTQKVLRPNLATESQPVKGHLEDENCVRFLPNGRQLASACEDGTVRLWDLESGTWIPLLPRFQKEVLALDVSPDGRFIAAAGLDGMIRIWDQLNHSVYAELPGHATPIAQLAFGQDGRFLASCDHAGYIDLWNVAERKLACPFRASGRVDAVALSPGDVLLATGEASGRVRIWNARTGQALSSRGSHIGHVRDVAFSHDGQRVASAGTDGCVRIWAVSNGVLQTEFRAHDAIAWRAKFSLDDREITTCGNDKTARVFALGVPMSAVHWATSKSIPIVRLAFGPAGNRLAMTTSDGRILMGDPRSEAELKVLPVRGAVNGWLSFSPNGSQLAFVDPEGDIKSWLLSERREATLVPHHASPRDWRLDRWRWWKTDTHPEFLTESHLVILHADGSLMHWDGDRSSEREMRSPITDAPNSQLAISTDKNTIALNENADSVVVLGTGPTETTLARIANAPSALALAFSPDGSELAIGLHNGAIRLLDRATREDRRLLVGHHSGAAALAFAPDGLTLASAGSDGTARLWDAETGQQLAILERRSGPLTSVAFSSDGRILAVAGAPHSEGATVSIYDAGPADKPVRGAPPPGGTRPSRP